MTSRFVVFFFFSSSRLLSDQLSELRAKSEGFLFTDATLLSQHLAILRPKNLPLRVFWKETHTVGLAVAAPAQPAEAGSAHVYMQAYRAHVAHFFGTTNA